MFERDISRRAAFLSLAIMLVHVFAACYLFGSASLAFAAGEHPIMEAIQKSNRGFGVLHRCDGDAPSYKFTVDMQEYAKDALAIVSGYGSQKLPAPDCGKRTTTEITGHSRAGHWGIDIWAPKGTPVISAHDGEVSISEFQSEVGNRIRIKSELLWVIYWRLDKRLVSVGDKVRRGDIIGTVGATGNVVYGRNPYLHFQTHEAWAAESNPHPYWIKSDPNLVLAAAFGDETKEKARVTLFRPDGVYNIADGDHRVLTYPIPWLKDMPHFLKKLEELERKR